MKGRWVFPVALAFGLVLLTFASAALASTDGRGGTGLAHRAPSLAAGTTSHVTVTGHSTSPSTVLYSQLDSPGANSSSSQDFEADFDAYNDELADDFVVPTAAQWSVDTVDAAGVYYNGGGPAAAFNVRFYSDTAGLPGTMVAERLAQAYTLNGSDFTITVSPAVSLTPGTYWVSVQARMDFNVGGQFGWTDRSVVSNSGAAWQNPGGGFGAGCITWDRKVNCIATADADQLFSVSGTNAPPPPPPPPPPHPPAPPPPAPAPSAPAAAAAAASAAPSAAAAPSASATSASSAGQAAMHRPERGR